MLVFDIAVDKFTSDDTRRIVSSANPQPTGVHLEV